METKTKLLRSLYLGLQQNTSNSGWWFHPLWKILVNWDDYNQKKEKYKSCSSHHQPELLFPKFPLPSLLETNQPTLALHAESWVAEISYLQDIRLLTLLTPDPKFAHHLLSNTIHAHLCCQRWVRLLLRHSNFWHISRSVLDDLGIPPCLGNSRHCTAPDFRPKNPSVLCGYHTKQLGTHNMFETIPTGSDIILPSIRYG